LITGKFSELSVVGRSRGLPQRENPAEHSSATDDRFDRTRVNR
jgi:hypothetical protein